MKKIFLSLLVACLIIPCAVMLTACGGNIFGKSSDNDKTFTKEYGADNCTNCDDYDEHFNYRFYPTVINNEPFEQVTIDIATPFDNFFTNSWDSQLNLQSNGNITILDGSKEVRASFSFNLSKENSEYVRANLSVNNSVNNNSVSNSRNINQTVIHSDTIKATITRNGICLVYGDTKLELPFENSLSKTATVNSATLYYTTQATDGTFFDYTFKY